jgi:hypothetical protein
MTSAVWRRSNVNRETVWSAGILSEQRMIAQIAAWLFLPTVFVMNSLIDLVAVISSHAERVSLAIVKSSFSEQIDYVFAFFGLVCLALTAGIFTGVGAVRGMTAFFFASAVYFYMGGILLIIAGLISLFAAFSALLSLAFRSSTPLPKPAAPSDLPSSTTSPPSSSKPKRSACLPSQISVVYTSLYDLNLTLPAGSMSRDGH